MTAEHVLRIRQGHGANCSSIGSAVDVLFASAAVSGALLAAVLAALASEDVRIAGDDGAAHGRSPDPDRAGGTDEGAP